MKLSARNVLEGKVLSIKKGPVSTEVDIETKGGERVVASITTASADSLKLEVGKKVYAVSGDTICRDKESLRRETCRKL